MKISEPLKYVESMRNIGYLTGFVRHINKIKQETWHKRQLPDDFNGYLLQQTGNIEQAIPIHLPEGVPMPADKSPITAAVHVFGYTDPSTGAQTVRVKGLDSSRPSLRAMPPSMVWSLDSNSKYMDDDFNPFGKGSKLAEEIDKELEKNDDQYTEAEAALQRMLAESKGRLDTRHGDNSNVVFVAGFLDSFKKHMPNEHRTQSFWKVHLRQHERKDRCLPVRIYTKDMKGIGSQLKVGLPGNFTGQIRVKVTPNDDKDGLLEGNVFIHTKDIYAANRVTDIKKVPDWYSKIREEHMQLRQRQKELMEQQRKDAAQTDPNEKESLMNKLTGKAV